MFTFEKFVLFFCFWFFWIAPHACVTSDIMCHCHCLCIGAPSEMYKLGFPSWPSVQFEFLSLREQVSWWLSIDFLNLIVLMLCIQSFCCSCSRISLTFEFRFNYVAISSNALYFLF